MLNSTNFRTLSRPKFLLKQSLLLRSFKYLLDDFLQGIKNKLSIMDTMSGSRHIGCRLEESIKYIEDAFLEYKLYGGVSSFHGRVAEIGPGDNAGIGLLMRKDGAEEIDLIDRFSSLRDLKSQEKIYQELSRKHDLQEFRIGENWCETKLSKIHWHKGISAEAYFEKNQHRYDYIVSRAVFEHLISPVAVLESMISSLKPRGKLIHKIDLRDHGLFSTNEDELRFLRIPEFIYRRMVVNSGRPNRVLLPEYFELLSKLRAMEKINFQIYVTRLVGVGPIVPHQMIDSIESKLLEKAKYSVEVNRDKFSKKFRPIPAIDLAVSGIFLVVEKL